jgi:hypothetical protein
VCREVCGFGQDLLQEDMRFQFFHRMESFHAVVASNQLVKVSSVLFELISVWHED